MLYTIYRVTHRESGKYYIGKHQTTDLNDGYMGSGRRICAAVKKYGVEAFIREVLHVFETEEEMNAKEAELVTEEFCLREDTYNLCPGGQGGWGYVNKHGLTNKNKDYKKLAEKLKGRQYTHSAEVLKQAHREGKISYDTFRGKAHTDLTKTKIAEKTSVTSSGSRNSQFGTFWITDGVLSKKTSGFIPEGWRRGRKIRPCSSEEERPPVERKVGVS